MLYGVEGLVFSSAGYLINRSGSIYSLNSGAFHARLLAELDVECAYAYNVNPGSPMYQMDKFEIDCYTNRGWLRISSRYDDLVIDIKSSAALNNLQVDAIVSIVNKHSALHEKITLVDCEVIGRRLIGNLRDALHRTTNQEAAEEFQANRFSRPRWCGLRQP